MQIYLQFISHSRKYFSKYIVACVDITHILLVFTPKFDQIRCKLIRK